MATRYSKVPLPALIRWHGGHAVRSGVKQPSLAQGGFRVTARQIAGPALMANRSSRAVQPRIWRVAFSMER